METKTFMTKNQGGLDTWLQEGPALSHLCPTSFAESVSDSAAWGWQLRRQDMLFFCSMFSSYVNDYIFACSWNAEYSLSSHGIEAVYSREEIDISSTRDIPFRLWSTTSAMRTSRSYLRVPQMLFYTVDSKSLWALSKKCPFCFTMTDASLQTSVRSLLMISQAVLRPNTFAGEIQLCTWLVMSSRTPVGYLGSFEKGSPRKATYLLRFSTL